MKRKSDREVALIELYVKLIRDPHVPDIAKKALIYLIRHTDNFSKYVFMAIPSEMKGPRELIDGIAMGVHNMVSCNGNVRIDDIFIRLGVKGFVRSFNYEPNCLIRFDEDIMGQCMGEEIPFNREAIEEICLDGTIDLDELQKSAEKLLALLRDRQGTMGWNDFMRDRIQELQRLLF
jgi:hypothetical protein